MAFDPKLHWILVSSREIPSEKATLFTFKTIESRDLNGFPYRWVADRIAKTEAEAWEKLTKPRWGIE